MTNGITIIIALPQDAKGIREVQWQTWLATYPNKQAKITREDIESFVNEKQEEKIAQTAERLRAETTSRTWIAKDDNRIIGFISVEKQKEKNKLHAIYIYPEYQGKGIGKQLMHEAFNWLGNEKDISLEVVSYNVDTISFYEKFGFIENGTTTNEVATLPNGKILPTIEMIRKAQYE